MIARVAVFGRRACAALAACSAVLHGIALVRATNLAATAVTVAMLVACLHCARDLWVRGTLRAWVLVASMNLAMIAIHVPASPAHHHGGGVTGGAPEHHATVMTLATALAAVEVVLAAAVVYYRTGAFGLQVSAFMAEGRGKTTPRKRCLGLVEGGCQELNSGQDEHGRVAQAPRRLHVP